MTLEKARKKALFGAVVSIVFGIGALIASGHIYCDHNQMLSSFSEQTSFPAKNIHMVRMFRAAAFLVVPAQCMVLVGATLDVLKYLRKWREQASPEAPSDATTKRLATARKQAVFAIVLASIVVLMTAFLFGYYNNWLGGFARRTTSPAENAFLLNRIKIVSYGVMPALSGIIIFSGVITFLSLRKQRE
jgi:hypothetical protein